MGHDILAGNFSDERVEQIHAALGRTMYPSQHAFETRLDHCGYIVAALRRSAFDDYNRVLYRALDAEEQYGGCSGKGEALWFDAKQLRVALATLPCVVADSPPPIDTTEAEEMFKIIEALLPKSRRGSPDFPEENDVTKREAAEPRNIQEEIDFVEQCLCWLDETGNEQIRIYFG